MCSPPSPRRREVQSPPLPTRDSSWRGLPRRSAAAARGMHHASTLMQKNDIGMHHIFCVLRYTSGKNAIT